MTAEQRSQERLHECFRSVLLHIDRMTDEEKHQLIDAVTSSLSV